MAPTGQLAQQAVAGGYESVRHMLSSIEGEGSDVAEFEFDDDEDNNQNEADNNGNEADKNNVTDVCNSNGQNNLEIQDDNDNVSDEVKCIDSNEQCNSGNHEDERVTEIKDTHEMIIDRLYRQLLSESV